MPVTITGSQLSAPGGTWTTRPTAAAIGGNYSIGYALGAYVMTIQVNPKTPQTYLNGTVIVNGNPGYLIPWPTSYWPYTQGGGPFTSSTPSVYTGTSNVSVTGFLTSVSSVVNFPATNTNYYAIPGVWRASGWCGDAEYIDEQYFYQLFRRVA